MTDTVTEPPAGCIDLAEGRAFWEQHHEGAYSLNDGADRPGPINTAGEHIGRCPACSRALQAK